MRRALPITLLLASLALAACTRRRDPVAELGRSVGRPVGRRRVAPSVAPSASPDACAKDTLTLKTAGKLTIGTDNPAYPPYFQQSRRHGTAPWETRAIRRTAKGFEGAFAYRARREARLRQGRRDLGRRPVRQLVRARPKAFDIDINQVSYKPERAAGRRPVRRLLRRQPVGRRAARTARFAAAKTDRRSQGRQVRRPGRHDEPRRDQRTSSQPTAEASVYDSNDAAIQALKAKQIDGIVVDLPTAFFVTPSRSRHGDRRPARRGRRAPTPSTSASCSTRAARSRRA